MAAKDPLTDENFNQTLNDFLKKPKIVGAIAKAISAWAGNQPDEIRLRFRALHLAYGFSIFIFIGITVLALLGLISKEVTAGLLGTLVGYWYGQRQQQNRN